MLRDRLPWIGVVGVAVALRLYGLTTQSLWHDELFTRYAATQSSLWAAIDVGAVQDVHPPGFVAAMYAWVRLAGDSEAALRLPSVLAGVLAVAWIARLGEAWFDRRTGLVAALLTAVSWLPIYYAQEARPYAWLFVGSIALVERITAAWRAPSRPGPLLQVAAIGVALAYLHYFGALFVALAYGAWGIGEARRRSGLRGWAAVVGGTLVAGLPWLGPLASQVGRGPIWIDPPTAGSVASVYASTANGSLVALAGVLGLGVLAGSRRPDPPTALLVVWATAPVAAALAVSWLVLPVLDDRNLIGAAPAVLLLGARALVAVDARVRRPLATGAVVALLLVDLLVVRDYYRRPTKWQYREVAATIAADARADPRPLVISGAWHPSYFDYYFARLPTDLRVDATAVGPQKIAAALPADPPSVLYVAAPVPERREKHRGKLQLDGWTRSRYWSFIGWDLYRFER
jgi:hypothetical protein